MSFDRFRYRLASSEDLPAIRMLMDISLSEHLSTVLSDVQVELSRSVMGLDTKLIEDGTYFLAINPVSSELVGSGGWSRRRTLFGGDHSVQQRNDALLDPATEPARIRAMYTHPRFTRKGIGRDLLNLCEGAARDAGFTAIELMATVSGEPLYRACGYKEIERTLLAVQDGVQVPGTRMGKALA